MLDLALRVTIILVAAWLASFAMKRASAASRHLLWHAALAAVVVAPLVTPIAPRLEIAAWRFDPQVAGARPSVSTGITRDLMAALPSATGAVTAATDAVALRFRLGAVATAVTVAGSFICALWFLLGWWSSALLVRRSTVAPLAWVAEVNALCARFQIRRDVDLRLVDAPTSPLAAGLWRATIVLPTRAHLWDADRRRAVLLHELAHIRRDDCRAQALAHLACVIYWFNPLVWVAAARLRAERERACDDEVLRSGAQPSSYATHLLDIARELQPSRRPTATLAMAQPSELEGRLLSVLASGRPRVSTRAARWGIGSALTLLTAVVVCASPAPSATPTLTEVVLPRPLFMMPEPGTLGDGDAIGRLLVELRDGDQDRREEATLRLAMMSNPRVIPALIAALADRDAQVREKAAIGLALRRDRRVVDALIAAIADPDSQVREKVAIALGTSGDVRAIAILQRALTDTDGQVREKAQAGLLLLGLGGIEP